MQKYTGILQYCDAVSRSNQINIFQAMRQGIIEYLFGNARLVPRVMAFGLRNADVELLSDTCIYSI